MTTVTWLAAAYGIAFVMNVIPGFMPATWTVLAFFYVRYHLPLLLLTVGGAASSSLGRLVLALATRRWGRNIVREKDRTELDILSTWAEHRPAWQIPLFVFAFSVVGVVPSNQLFLAAGLTTINLRPIVLAFFAGRSISYTVSALAAAKVTYGVTGLMTNYWSSPSAWLIQLVSLALIVAFSRIPWSKVLRISIPTDTSEGEQGIQGSVSSN